MKKYSWKKETHSKKEGLALFLITFPSIKEDSIKILESHRDELLFEVEELKINIKLDYEPSIHPHKFYLRKEIEGVGEIELHFFDLLSLGEAMSFTKEQYEENGKHEGNALMWKQPDTFKELVKEIAEEVYTERNVFK